ncbi:MAG TPA: transcriptional repressor LexA [Kofleriaceae bacterium]|jgi:repressor LexA
MADALTQRQREILEFISSSIADRGFPPTLREIGEFFHIRSTNGVNDHLKALEKKGHLRREDLKSRAMRPILPDGSGELVAMRPRLANGTNAHALADSDELADVPILGKVAAGEPILAVENATDSVKIDRVLLGGHREVFGLKIVGESMIEDGIFDGDYVFVKKTPAARTGEIVVAMIEGEATVKRYYPEGDKIRFQPANSTMQPIIVSKADFKSVDIIGIVVGIYRKL